MGKHIIGAACKFGQGKDGVNWAPFTLLSDITTQKLMKDNCESIQVTSSDTASYDYATLYDAVLNKPDVLTIGGDHSIAMATVAASLKKHGTNLHVLWIDAHADINTPESSTSGNTHGMPVSTLLGDSTLMDVPVKLLPEQLTYIGLRDVDPPEWDMLKRNNIRWYSSDDVRTRGINTIMTEILQSLDPTTKFHVSLDIDAIDPEFVTATGTPVPGGLHPDDVHVILQEVKKSTVAVDLVEFNPYLGDFKSTFDCVVSLLKTILLPTPDQASTNDNGEATLVPVRDAFENAANDNDNGSRTVEDTFSTGIFEKCNTFGVQKAINMAAKDHLELQAFIGEDPSNNLADLFLAVKKKAAANDRWKQATLQLMKSPSCGSISSLSSFRSDTSLLDWTMSRPRGHPAYGR